MSKPIQKILIANRGEIAMRILATCRRLGIEVVAVHSSADRNTPIVRNANEAVEIGAPEAAQSYLNIEKIVAACKRTGADAVHPGYGFLSENEDFAQALAAEGIIFIGPEVDAIRAMGDKLEARRLMEKSGVAVVPGYDGDDQSEPTLVKEAEKIGYPVMIKATRGGGGRGMRRVDRPGDFSEALASAKREALSAFGSDALILEKFVEAPRHIEVQVFGDKHGNTAHLFERECSIQRRHQKIIEESPSPALDGALRTAICETAVRAAQAVNYTGAGTVEFIFSDKTRSFYFLEMNTRLQVEHPVTEMVVGRDLVEEQIRVAEGAALSFRSEDLTQNGHAVEARLYAEDPERDFMPATGPMHLLEWPEIAGVRIDSGIESGDEVSIFYDPMVAKVIAHGPTRQAALQSLERALGGTILFGPRTNLDFLRAAIAHPAFIKGDFTTAFVDEHMSPYRGPSPSPDAVDLARITAGLLFYAGAKHVAEEQAVAGAGGDLAPWYDSNGFRIWE